LPERFIGALIPTRPYRCRSCGKRFWGLARPVMTFSRALFALLAAFLLVELYFRFIY